jgi:hypothetical protein
MSFIKTSMLFIVLASSGAVLAINPEILLGWLQESRDKISNAPDLSLESRHYAIDAPGEMEYGVQKGARQLFQDILEERADIVSKWNEIEPAQRAAGEPFNKDDGTAWTDDEYTSVIAAFDALGGALRARFPGEL